MKHKLFLLLKERSIQMIKIQPIDKIKAIKIKNTKIKIINQIKDIKANKIKDMYQEIMGICHHHLLHKLSLLFLLMSKHTVKLV